MRKLLLKTLSAACLLTMAIHAEQSNEGQTPFFGDISAAPIGTKTIKKNVDKLKSKEREEGVIKDSGLAKKTIQSGMLYPVHTGKNHFEVTTDENGNTVLKDLNTNTTSKYRFPTKGSEQYLNAKRAYFESVDKNMSEQEQNERYLRAKKARRSEVFNKNYSLKGNEEITTGKLDPRGAAGSSSTFMSSESNGTGKDSNMTTFYRNSYGISPDKADRTQFESNPNLQKLNKAYQAVDDMERIANGRMSSAVIKCFISRELMPAYRCSFPDMTTTLYPDFSSPLTERVKISSQEAKNECNKNCHKPRQCVAHHLLDSADKNTTATVKIWPYTLSQAEKDIPLTLSMQAKSISMKITVTKSSEFGGTDKEFDEFLRSLGKPLKFKLQIKKKDLSGENDEVLLKATAYKLRGSVTEIEIPMSAVTSNLHLKFFKPHIYDKLYTLKGRDLLNKIGEIKITNIRVRYASDSLYFCPFKQFVDNTEECPGGDIINVKNDSGNAVKLVCTNPAHKVGPDPINGAFYTEESCETSCVEYKPCKPTYSHYADMNVDQVYQTTIGCVEDPDNTSCTDSLCKSFFADLYERPVNEVVVQNDDTRVYTIRNSVSTDVPRPKIDYNKESNTMTSSQRADAFQIEMKDDAYQNMIENQTFNIVKYPIGTSSPRKQAISYTTGAKTSLILHLKGDGDLYDNGQSYNLYQVLKVKEAFRPHYGVFLTKGHMSDAKHEDLQLEDDMYLIRQPSGLWKVFREEFSAKVRDKKVYVSCPTGVTDENGEDTVTRTLYRENQIIPENCNKETEIRWVDAEDLKKIVNGFYFQSSDDFSEYSLSETAPYFKKIKFDSDHIIMDFEISENLSKDIELTPGAIIRDQEKKDNEVSFKRIYNKPFALSKRGFLRDVEVFSFYSQADLTYGNIINNYLNDDNMVWKKSSPSYFPETIKGDGRFNNNIKVFKVGPSRLTTVEETITPDFTESGKHVYKFMFLKPKVPINIPGMKKLGL